jgi:hypothetical protein
MVRKHEKMLTILAMKEMQIKTTLRFHLTLLEWLPRRTQMSWQRHGEKGTLIHCW